MHMRAHTHACAQMHMKKQPDEKQTGSEVQAEVLEQKKNKKPKKNIVGLFFFMLWLLSLYGGIS